MTNNSKSRRILQIAIVAGLTNQAFGSLGPIMFAGSAAVAESEWKAAQLGSSISSTSSQGSHNGGFCSSFFAALRHTAQYPRIAPSGSFAAQTIQWNGGRFQSDSEIFLVWSKEGHWWNSGWPGLGASLQAVPLMRQNLFASGGEIVFRFKAQELGSFIFPSAASTGPFWDGSLIKGSVGTLTYNQEIRIPLRPAFYQNHAAVINGQQFLQPYIPFANTRGDDNYVAGSSNVNQNGATLAGVYGRHVKSSFEIEILPVSRVTGQASLDEFSGGSPGALEVEVWKDGSRVETLDGNRDQSGRYAFWPVTTGTVTLKFRMRTGLWKAVSVTLGTGPIENLNVAMTNGDVDGDNVIGLFDYLLLFEAFDTMEGDARWDTRADLDGDGEVGLFDYLILSENFDREGD